MLWPRPTPPVAVSTASTRPTASPAPTLVVHVIGAVANPGVYQLPGGTRATDAIAAAGGMLEGADAASLNLAARLVDGQQVAVRSVAAGPADGASHPDGKSARLNLNRATAAELDALPGLGPALSARILDRRQKIGPFQSVDQLRDERLIPASTFDRIKDLLTVE